METIGCQFWRFVKGGGGYRKTPVFRQRRAQTETPFAAEFHDSRAAAFLLCPLMRQKWAVIILIAARVDLRPLIEQSERGGMAPAAGSIVNRPTPGFWAAPINFLWF